MIAFSTGADDFNTSSDDSFSSLNSFCNLYQDEYCIKLGQTAIDLNKDMSSSEIYDYLLSQGMQEKEVG